VVVPLAVVCVRASGVPAFRWLNTQRPAWLGGPHSRNGQFTRDTK
jgi:hypothetical protein